MTRIAHAWRALEREQHLAALTAIGLFVSMFLPWYSKANTFVEHGAAKATQTSLSAFQAFSFVEAAVLLVSAGVLTILFSRGEGRDFQLPGGDGLVVMVAGAWAALLIFYRLLDKPGLQASQRITATVGVEWGIFIALLLAIGLFYAGQRMRAEERPDPPLMRRRGGTSGPSSGPSAPRPPRERPPDLEGRSSSRPVPARAPSTGRPPEHDVHDASTEVSPPAAASSSSNLPRGGERRPSTSRPRFPPPPSEQMSFEDPPHSQPPPAGLGGGSSSE